jgi:hypothetical protein
MVNWNFLKSSDFWKGTSVVVGSKMVKTGVIQSLKNFTKVSAGWLPVVGNVIGAIDDIYQEIKINGLQETASALKNSQSLLNGQVTELQAGLQEAKDRELELATEQQRLASELANASEETKA